MNAGASAELAIVIVNYNTRGYLERCLETLETHRGEITTDVLVIDNAPRTDASLEVVRQFPGVRYVREERAGLDIARCCGKIGLRIRHWFETENYRVRLGG